MRGFLNHHPQPLLPFYCSGWVWGGVGGSTGRFVSKKMGEKKTVRYVSRK